MSRRKPALLRPVVSSRSGMCSCGEKFHWLCPLSQLFWLTCDSDGIARVHGMNNVQAEELVEYVPPQLLYL